MMPSSTGLSITPAHPHPRTEAALQRLRQAMRDIEHDIEAHHGVYPFNHGRVTQSELCRRADVKKATLQNPVHKDTTRVEIMRWLDALEQRLGQTRQATRERVTAVTQHLSAEMTTLAERHAQLQQQHQQAQARIAELEQENALLRQQLARR